MKAQSASSSIVQVSALILARGCSKSIVGKNVKKFLDIPLVCHTVKVALACNHFISVWISTDDLQVSQLVTQTFAASDARVHIHSRSTESASDTATSLQSVTEFLNFAQLNEICSCDCCALRKRPQLTPSNPLSREDGQITRVTALIQCTSPILHSQHLQSACELMAENANSIDSIFSAFTHGTSLQWERDNASGKLKAVNFDPYNRPRRQNMNADSTYVESGHFYFFNNLLPLQQGLLQSLECGKQAIYVMHPACCIELDEPYQWQIAEALYRIAQNNNFYLHHQDITGPFRLVTLQGSQ